MKRVLAELVKALVFTSEIVGSSPTHFLFYFLTEVDFMSTTIRPELAKDNKYFIMILLN